MTKQSMIFIHWPFSQAIKYKVQSGLTTIYIQYPVVREIPTLYMTENAKKKLKERRPLF